MVSFGSKLREMMQGLGAEDLTLAGQEENKTAETKPTGVSLRKLVNSDPDHPNNNSLWKSQEEWDRRARDLGRQGLSVVKIKEEIGARPS